MSERLSDKQVAFLADLNDGHVACDLAREVIELRKDRDRLDWLESCEHCLRTHREKPNRDEYEIWWTVTTPNGTSLTHPFGNARAAIDAAMKQNK